MQNLQDWLGDELFVRESSVSSPFLFLLLPHVLFSLQSGFSFYHIQFLVNAETILNLHSSVCKIP